jgi:hypothetical protein
VQGSAGSAIVVRAKRGYLVDEYNL